VESKARYYLHGDESEDLRGTYYCKKCDVFYSSDHFAKTCGGEAHASIYQRHLGNMFSRSQKAKISRPPHPPSIAQMF